jgi:hypothetical protein
VIDSALKFVAVLFRIIGILMMIVGPFYFVYVGVWQFCIMSIVDFINAVQMSPIPGLTIVLSVFKLLIAPIFTIIGVMASICMGLIISVIASEHV